MMVKVTAVQRKQSPWKWEMKEEESNMSGPSVHPEEMLPKIMEYNVPRDGILRLNVEITNETETLTIDADLEDSHETLHLHRSYTSPSHSYLQIGTPYRHPEAVSILILPVRSNFPITEFHYIVMSRGQVVSAGKAYRFLYLEPETSWAPVACVIVYCVRPDGEIVNDVMQLPVTQTLQNQVSLSFNQVSRKPGEEVRLRVKVAESASLVGILVVDKATKWKGDNDITKEAVLKEMKEYATADDAHSDMMTMGDPFSVFKTCDLVALTDASLHEMRPPPRPEFPGEERFFMTQGDGSHVEQHQEPRERRNFPETWIWMDINTNNSDTAEMTLTVPDSITTWTATAFVMSENLGLGIVEEPVELRVSQFFFISLNLPAYIIRGEELLLEVVLFNSYYIDLEVVVIVAASEIFEFVYVDDDEIHNCSQQQVLLR
ncbi:CD109 antigen-like [Sebastes umbrosus]|uniref:CD109 antigen-like n=1 Tax=Sebastes umbrosus TaxID=72105 RepID=UPI00189E40C6|nr:CD109 antigen-like [Sebastes umbrosus]